MLKFRNSIILLVFIIITVLIINACDSRKGKLNPNSIPIISITNYFGVDDEEDLGDPEIFQQTIEWSAYDIDGVVEGFAFRVLNEEGVPIPTAGYEVLDENGWVKHYRHNADTSIPLDQSDETTIWIEQTFVEINFPAADASGDSVNTTCSFQVKCIDNREGESATATKYFNAFSNVPYLTVSSSKGFIDGETIGLGVVIKFVLPLGEGLAVNYEAYYFKYKLEKRDLDHNLIPESEGGYPDQWFDTFGQEDIEEITLTSETELALTANTFEGETPLDSTYILAKGVNIAGVETDPVTISFLISDVFSPGTVIYYGEGNGWANDIYALGEHHFATYLDDALSVILPSILTPDGIHNATAFWVNMDHQYILIGSEDIKIYMHWGWHGEFGDYGVDDYNDPHAKKNDVVLDELTGASYFSEITYFDLRLDGAPLYYPPLPATGENLRVDDDGTEWLRVPVNHAIGQRVMLNLTTLGGIDNLYGEHTFVARAVDLQDVVDDTPHEFIFYIEVPCPKEEKDGIMIIDDEVDTNNAPADTVNNFYDYIISDFETNPGYIDRFEIKELIYGWNLEKLHFKKAFLSPTDFQHYKTIIYHTDDPISVSHFVQEYESLKIYLLQGGNIIFSTGAELETVQINCRDQYHFPILEDYFGIPLLDENVVVAVSKNWGTNPFFIKAISQFGTEFDINLQLPSFNAQITNPMLPELLSKDGLGPVAYFNEEIITSEIIYRYGCKEPGEEPHPPFHTVPTQEEYDMYNNLPVGIQNITENNSCYLFSFPLVYMVKEEVKVMMNHILSEIGH